MEAAVRLIDAFLPPILDGANHAFEEGSVSEVVAGGEEACDLLLNALTGLCPLAGGKIVLLGQDPGELSREELSALRSRMGIFHRGGGLISNLKVIENVALPLLYHSSESTDEISERAAASLERAGYRGNLFELPGRLSTFQRTAAGFARVLATDPDVVIYDRMAIGLHDEERAILLRAAFAFHREKPGRATIFLASRPGSIAGDEPITVVNLAKGQLA